MAWNSKGSKGYSVKKKSLPRHLSQLVYLFRGNYFYCFFFGDSFQKYSKHTLINKMFLFPMIFFLALPRGMWDLSSPTRDETRAPCSGSAESTTGPPGKSQYFPWFNFILLRKWRCTDDNVLLLAFFIEHVLAIILLWEIQGCLLLLSPRIPFINWFPTDGILGCFQSLVITDKTTVNNFVHAWFHTCEGIMG